MGGSTEVGLADILTTAGDAIYFAKGILETEQETIIATRNARIAQTSINQTQSVFSTSQSFVRSPPPQARQQANQVSDDSDAGGDDPLSQTFMVEGVTDAKNDGGRFITSIDVFFGTKDDTLPVTMEI